MHIDDWELLQNLILQVLVKNVILDNYKVVFFFWGGGGILNTKHTEVIKLKKMLKKMQVFMKNITKPNSQQF